MPLLPSSPTAAIVPSAAILEHAPASAMVSWSMSRDIADTGFTIGVAYKSDTVSKLGFTALDFFFEIEPI
jgi:hypothetical protein